MKILKSSLREIRAKYKTVKDVNNACLHCSNDVAEYFRRIFPVELNEREAMIVLYLNNSNTTVGFSTAGIGGITSTVVDVRLILRDALLTGSTSIILCHNHPSQSLKPSQADLNLTKKVKMAGEIMDIKLLDHLILTENSYYSFTDSGKL